MPVHHYNDNLVVFPEVPCEEEAPCCDESKAEDDMPQITVTVNGGK